MSIFAKPSPIGDGNSVWRLAEALLEDGLASSKTRWGCQRFSILSPTSHSLLMLMMLFMCKFDASPDPKLPSIPLNVVQQLSQVEGRFCHLILRILLVIQPVSPSTNGDFYLNSALSRII